MIWVDLISGRQPDFSSSLIPKRKKDLHPSSYFTTKTSKIKRRESWIHNHISSPKACHNSEVMSMAVMVVVVVGLVLINHPLNMLKFVNMARDGDCALVLKPVLFLGLLEKLQEERVVEVNHRHYEPLLLFSFSSDLDCQTPLRHVLHRHSLIILLVEQVSVESALQYPLFPAHIYIYMLASFFSSTKEDKKP